MTIGFPAGRDGRNRPSDRGGRGGTRTHNLVNVNHAPDESTAVRMVSVFGLAMRTAIGCGREDNGYFLACALTDAAFFLNCDYPSKVISKGQAYPNILRHDCPR